jgi:Legionella pneumophila major outer membrane protein precursor
VPAGTVDRVRQDFDLEMSAFDLAFGKTIPVCSCYQKCCGGCDPCCGDTCCDTCCDSCSDSCCDPCGDSCCCCPCPAWDFTWRAGVRFAEVDWQRTGTVTTLAPNANIVGFTTFDFEGGGPRVGLTGRRYCGQSRIFSLFASSDMAILLGDMSMTHSQNNGAVVTNFSNTQLFPVLDIEAGGEVQVTCNLKLSAGYLFSAWFDMGMRDTIVPLAANQGAWFDDANILGFDGLFARAEYAF